MKKTLLVAGILAALSMTTISTYASNSSTAETEGFMPMMAMQGFDHGMFGFDGQKPTFESEDGTGKMMHMERNHGKRGELMKKKGPKMSDAVQAALKANDYDSFVTARTTEQTNKTAPTQEQFTQRVSAQKAHAAVEAAVEAGNYEAFKTAIAALPKMDKMEEQGKTPPVPTEAQFKKMVEMKTAHAAVEVAVEAGNYEAFKIAIAALPKLDKMEEQGKTPSVPTEEQFKKMQEMHTKNKAMESAVIANDYQAFLKTWEANRPSVPTKEEFASMVTKHSSMEEKKSSTNYKERLRKTMKRIKERFKK